ncbi:MAG TPA: LLM class flavin-dependent oxidoreductase, partial [Methylomirabilota bacterium]
MRLGVSVPTARPDGAPLTGDALVGSAEHIERAGFDSAWFFDAIGRGFILPDPLIGASVAAAVTRRIEIGTGVLQVPLRNPVELAHR